MSLSTSLYNITINHNSSLIAKVQQDTVSWESGGSGDDTYHVTNGTSNKLVLEFSGSAITMHGNSTRGFNADLDSNVQRVEASNGTNSGPLYSDLDLELGFHRLVIGDFDEDGNSSVPFEFRLSDMVIGSAVADAGANWTTQVIRSDDPSIETYGDLTTRDVGEYGQSILVTSSAPANEQDCGISFNFTGTSIAIYAPPQGDIPLQRTFDVYFNSSAHPQPYDTKAYNQIYSNMPLQFQANGLPEGTHRLVMRCLRGGDENRSLGFDHAVAVVPERYSGINLCFVNCTSNNTLKNAPAYIYQPGMVTGRASAVLSLSAVAIAGACMAALTVSL